MILWRTIKLFIPETVLSYIFVTSEGLRESEAITHHPTEHFNRTKADYRQLFQLRELQESAASNLASEIMSDFTITIKNQSGFPQRYFVYAKAPEVTDAQKISQCVYANVQCNPAWTTELRIKGGTYYAINCMESGMKSGDTPSIVQSQRMTLGGSVISFEGAVRGGEVRDGSFIIRTGNGEYFPTIEGF